MIAYSNIYCNFYKYFAKKDLSLAKLLSYLCEILGFRETQFKKRCPRGFFWSESVVSILQIS